MTCAVSGGGALDPRSPEDADENLFSAFSKLLRTSLRVTSTEPKLVEIARFSK